MSDKNNSLKKAAISAAVGTAVGAALAVPPVLLFDYIVKKGRKFEIKDAFKKRSTEGKRSVIKISREIRKLSEREFEEVSIKSEDGLTLYGKYYRNPVDTNKLVICMHGYRSSDFYDFACAFDYFMSRGFNVLLASQRAHGKSEGRYITFGEKERFDCKAWTEYAAKRFGFGCEILLDGVSMGATTVLLASALELPHNVKAIVADCGFTSAWNIVENIMHKSHLSAFPYLYLTNAYSKLKSDFDFKAADTRKAVALTDIPIFFAHGASDDFVPCGMTIQAFDACASDKKLFIVPGAGHATSYLKAKDEYEKELDRFLSKYIKIQSKANAKTAEAKS